jgi:hypothetical protein
MTTKLNESDQKWIDALKPFWGGGTVPFWRNEDGTINAARTIDWMMRTRGEKKLDPKTGAEIPWPMT